MSHPLATATARATRPATAPAPRRAGSPGPQRQAPLRVVQAPPTAGSPLAFALLCVTLLAAGLIGLLLLNTAVAQDSFGLQRLRGDSADLTDQQEALVQTLALANSPQQLSTRAYALGMVPAAGSAFLELPSGKVVGVAAPAPRSKPPTVDISTTGHSGNSSTGAAGKNVPASAGTDGGVRPSGPPASRVDLSVRPAALPPGPPAAPKAGTTPGGTTTTGTTRTTTAHDTTAR